MKKPLLLSLFIIFYFNVNAQEYSKLIRDADAQYDAKEYNNAINLYGSAFKIESKNAAHLYNAACAAALANNEKKGFEWLRLSIDKGYTNINHLKKDTDLDNLHSNSKWNKMLEKLTKKVALIEANYDKPLMTELQLIREEDQKYRNQINELRDKFGAESKESKENWKIIAQKDSTNVIKVTKILDEKGWVGKNKIGQLANSAIFAVIQHADLQIQKKYLPMMVDAVKKGNAIAADLALLIDRIEMREGRKQIYGSQLRTNPETKKLYLYPILDPDNIDKKRAEVGLSSISEYLLKFKLTWDLEQYKKDLPELEKLHKL